jgi:protein O-GlcNAc transferase
VKRLRLGYISPDFRTHSAAFIFSPIIWGHDRARFEVFCYSSVMVPDPMTTKFKAIAEHWIEAYKLSDQELVERVRADGIDIAIDLAGHTAQTRLPAFVKRMASIQVSGWGYLAAPGIPEIDWHFADPVLIPPGERHHYVEKIWDLPSVFHYQPPEGCPTLTPLPASANGYVTFGYLGRWSKVMNHTIAVWASILRAVPGSRLFLKDRQFTTLGGQALARARFGDVGDRLDFRGISGHGQHLEAYQRVDIALDPWPMGGGVTVCEALWMGVPSITLVGDRPSSRAGASIMSVASLRGFVARDVEAYQSMALAWANLGYLPALRATMRDRMRGCALSDTVAYVRSVEDAYLDMWRRDGHRALPPL